MKKAGRKLKKGSIAAIITIAATALLICVLFVINLFYPIKYAATYFVLRSRSASDGIYMHFIDVDNADCTIVELPDGKTMLIDGGNGSYVTTYKILKKLNSLDINTIDYLVCTSVNEEHCGGLADIIKQKTVKTIYYPYSTNVYLTDGYYEFYTAAKESGADMVISEYGVGAGGGEGATEYFFTFLSPSVSTNEEGEYYAMNTSPTEDNMNNASAVLWLQCGGKGIFYAGDVLTGVLDGIVQSYNFFEENGLGSYFSCGGYNVDFSDCVLYKVANHGDYNSLCHNLYELLKPDISVISVGEDNADDCPSAYVITDLSTYSSPLYITMYMGDICVKVNSDGATVQ